MTTSDITDKLNALIETGFHFVHPRDTDGEVVAVVGVRIHNDVVDVVRVHAEDDAIATRAPADEEDVLKPEAVLWEYQGNASEVIDTVLALPDLLYTVTPANHRRARSGCWVGDGRGRQQWLSASA